MTTKLTDSQKQTIRIALNEWLGWKPNGAGYWHKDGDIRALSWESMDGRGRDIEPLEDPAASLDACHEIELKLTDKEHEAFQRLLWANCRKDHTYKYSYAVGDVAERRAFVSASAKQRSLALFLALNLGELGD